MRIENLYQSAWSLDFQELLLYASVNKGWHQPGWRPYKTQSNQQLQMHPHYWYQRLQQTTGASRTVSRFLKSHNLAMQPMPQGPPSASAPRMLRERPFPSASCWHAPDIRVAPSKNVIVPLLGGGASEDGFQFKVLQVSHGQMANWWLRSRRIKATIWMMIGADVVFHHHHHHHLIRGSSSYASTHISISQQHHQEQQQLDFFVFFPSLARQGEVL